MGFNSGFKGLIALSGELVLEESVDLS